MYVMYTHTYSYSVMNKMFCYASKILMIYFNECTHDSKRKTIERQRKEREKGARDKREQGDRLWRGK